MQQYTLQCTIRRDSSATLPLPSEQHCISDVAIRRLFGHCGIKDLEDFTVFNWERVKQTQNNVNIPTGVGVLMTTAEAKTICLTCSHPILWPTRHCFSGFGIIDSMLVTTGICTSRHRLVSGHFIGSHCVPSNIRHATIALTSHQCHLREKYSNSCLSNQSQRGLHQLFALSLKYLSRKKWHVKKPTAKTCNSSTKN